MLESSNVTQENLKPQLEALNTHQTNTFFGRFGEFKENAPGHYFILCLLKQDIFLMNSYSSKMPIEKLTDEGKFTEAGTEFLKKSYRLVEYNADVHDQHASLIQRFRATGSAYEQSSNQQQS